MSCCSLLHHKKLYGTFTLTLKPCLVEKDRFNYLVRNYNSLTQQETAELRAEQDNFSYCQLLHNLIARGDQDNQTEMKEMSLTVAAVYSTDRTVLKQIMKEPRTHRLEDFDSIQTIETPVLEPVQKEVTTPVTDELKNIVATEVIEEQQVETKPVESILVTKPLQAESSTPQIPDSNFDPEAALSKFIADLGPMREMKLKFEQALEEFDKEMANKGSDASVEKPKRKPRVSKSTTEHLLEEIKSTKKKVAPESQKQIDQIEIIDQFIKAKPAIPKATVIQVPLDLTDASDTYNENVVSETLALILIKQGKKEKAVEVLRKLIWKFPQKKAYFAAQIEDLTK